MTLDENPCGDVAAVYPHFGARRIVTVEDLEEIRSHAETLVQRFGLDPVQDSAARQILFLVDAILDVK